MKLKFLNQPKTDQPYIIRLIFKLLVKQIWLFQVKELCCLLCSVVAITIINAPGIMPVRVIQNEVDPPPPVNSKQVWYGAR